MSMGSRALAYDPDQLTNSKGLTVNGHDDLKLVQQETERLPGVVTAPLPATLKKSSQNPPMPVDSANRSSPESSDSSESSESSSARGDE